ncbi:MAG: endonuclease/exonuclease/phosphatase family protein [Aeriscardovia sp.]|nr:endonuclease/exonuclease/phosphatase family protein [Aeriscardovia sp.]
MAWLWILTILIGLWMCLRYLPAGFDARRPVGELIALTPLLCIPLVVLVVVSACINAWWPFAIELFLLACEVWFHRGYFFGAKPKGTGLSRDNESTTNANKSNVNKDTARNNAQIDAATNTDELEQSGHSVLDVLLVENGGAEDKTEPTPNAFLLNTLGEEAAAKTTNQSDEQKLANAIAAPLPATEQEKPTGLTLMTLNCRYGRANPSAIINAVRRYHVDVLALQEASAELEQSLIDGRLILDLPYHTAGAPTKNDNGGFNMIWTRDVPATLKPSTIDLEAAAAPGAVIKVGDQSVLVASAHPKSPHRGGQYWGYGIAHLSEFLGYTGLRKPAIPAHVPAAVEPITPRPEEHIADSVIVMGDLNSSLDIPSFRSLLNAGLIDSSLETHSGMHLTFPTSWPAVPRVLELDHILHSRGLVTTEITAFKVPGTDHAALIAHLVEA